MTNINFLLSSITFLQYYLPIVIESNKRNIQSIFYIRKNSKKYADPTTILNSKILNHYIVLYNILITTDNTIQNGPIICVDGDIYGPFKEDIESLLTIQKTTNRKTNNKIYSLQENLNFIWNYDYYEDKVDYIIFPNESYAQLYNKISDKNVYLGNTKYDYILERKHIYKKYKLNVKNKYVLVLFPKEKFINTYGITSQHILTLYNYLHYMGFNIIVKSRPKDNVYPDCRGDLCVISDVFPNESLELMKISELCILFSSSAIEETIMMEIPTIDLKVDDEISKRLEFLYKENTIQQIKSWKNLKYETLSKTIQKLASKNSQIYKDLKKEYLFEGNISKRIIDFIHEN
jgi:hypothetical protein